MESYVKYGDGFADITLAKAIIVDGAKRDTLRMREPTVEDQLVMDAIEGGNAQKELTMMANLCTVTTENLRGMSLRNYKRLQVAFAGFID